MGAVYGLVIAWRKRVWPGGAGLLLGGVLIGATGNTGQQLVETKVKPATTITATVTATPRPGPTVTETVEVKAKPTPTVTVTRTAAAKAASSGCGGSSSHNSVGTCSIKSNAGNCYSAGRFCRNSDHGAVTTTAGGTPIKCTYSSNAWRWKYA
ncbi:hypothetical protein [Streptomyces sp. NRRL S-646]|uniref:hypothetical protein n=1 Tax=Streptomyces sp. NRRL S-646 TaxID=1463917 RepID=UPI00068B424C|nr:hypothetical protein [Streptomyces sp. NRRL S-646]